MFIKAKMKLDFSITITEGKELSTLHFGEIFWRQNALGLTKLSFIHVDWQDKL